MHIITMKGFCGQTFRNDNDHDYCCMSNYWNETKFDEKGKYSWKLPNESYIIKMVLDGGLKDEKTEGKKATPSQLGAFILSNS